MIRIFAMLQDLRPSFCGRAGRRAAEALHASETNRRIRERAVAESQSSTERLRVELRNLGVALRGAATR